VRSSDSIEVSVIFPFSDFVSLGTESVSF
jgi:hypothetical protein